ncbi:MAG: hypothetical protein WCF90_02300 [Methanomicrobiales archaeon]
MVTLAVAALGTITPAAENAISLVAVLIGAIAGIVCYDEMFWRMKSGMDECLDAKAVYWVGGFIGTIFAGIFEITTFCNYSGPLKENVHYFTANIFGVMVWTLYAFVVTCVIVTAFVKTLGAQSKRRIRRRRRRRRRRRICRP